MRNGHIICGLAYDAAHLVAAAEGLPPASVTTTDWSFYPKTQEPKLFKGATYFLLRIPGDSKGLYRALEEMLDVAGVYREHYDYTGLKNHLRLLEAVGKIQRGTTDRVIVNFWFSPERIRERELEYFELAEEDYWHGYRQCMADPGCAAVARETFPARAC